VVGRRPSILHKLCRIDLDKPFEPGNVQWAMSETQRVPTVTAARDTWNEISAAAIEEDRSARHN
jgi:hypothetical protein